MKSIKEKAEEYADKKSYLDISVYTPHQIIEKRNNPEYSWFDLKDTYEDAANAVLDEIEKLVKFNRWTAQDLYELIEQLKK